MSKDFRFFKENYNSIKNNGYIESELNIENLDDLYNMKTNEDNEELFKIFLYSLIKTYFFNQRSIDDMKAQIYRFFEKIIKNKTPVDIYDDILSDKQDIFLLNWNNVVLECLVDNIYVYEEDVDFEDNFFLKVVTYLEEKSITFALENFKSLFSDLILKKFLLLFKIVHLFGLYKGYNEKNSLVYRVSTLKKYKNNIFDFLKEKKEVKNEKLLQILFKFIEIEIYTSENKNEVLEEFFCEFINLRFDEKYKNAILVDFIASISSTFKDLNVNLASVLLKEDILINFKDKEIIELFENLHLDSKSNDLEKETNKILLREQENKASDIRKVFIVLACASNLIIETNLNFIENVFLKTISIKDDTNMCYVYVKFIMRNKITPTNLLSIPNLNMKSLRTVLILILRGIRNSRLSTEHENNLIFETLQIIYFKNDPYFYKVLNHVKYIPIFSECVETFLKIFYEIIRKNKLNQCLPTWGLRPTSGVWKNSFFE